MLTDDPKSTPVAAPRLVAADLCARVRARGGSVDEDTAAGLLARRAEQLARALRWTPGQAWDYLAGPGLADIAMVMTAD